MVEMKEWDATIVTFKDRYDLISWEQSHNDDLIEVVEYECYDCFTKLSLGERELRATQLAYDHVTWSNGGHSPPIYTSFCRKCNAILNIPTLYCCINHQIKIKPTDTVGILKIMIKQITTEKTLCPYLVFQTSQYHKLTDEDIDNVIKHGKKHIKLFISTPAGMMLHALKMER